MRKKFDEQIEMQIVQDRLSGATIREIEAKYGCNKKYVQRLMKRHSQQGDIQKRDNSQGDIQEGDIRKGDVNAKNIDSKSNEALDEGDIKGDNQGDIHVGDNEQREAGDIEKENRFRNATQIRRLLLSLSSTKNIICNQLTLPPTLDVFPTFSNYR